MKRSLAAVVLLLLGSLPGRADSSFRREIIDLSKFELLRTIGRWYTHSLSPTGQAFAVFETNVVRVVDLREERETQKLAGHVGPIHDSGWSRDGRYLATSGFDAQVRVWDTWTGKSLFCVTPHSGYACSVAFSPDGKWLATGGSEDATIKVLDATTGREIRSILTPDAAIFGLAFSAEGKHIVFEHSITNRAEMGFRVVRVSDGSEEKGVYPGTLSTFAVSRDGRFVACGRPSGMISVIETDRWTEIRRFDGHPGGASTLAFHPAGRYLASGGRDGAVRLWDFEAGSVISMLPVKSETECRLTFSADGRTLVVASFDATLRIFGRRPGMLSVPRPAPPGAEK